MQGAGGLTTEALTAIEDDALSFIVFYIEKKGYPPSISEIAAATVRSRTATHATLRQLQAKGYLEIDPGPRCLRVVER
jgi:SOS-response transcriptional repressor LexA